MPKLKRLFQKKKNLFATRVTPGTEKETIATAETESNATQFGPRRFSLDQTAKILHVQRFFARAREKKETTTLNIFSLHGYSSLRMMQDGPKACREKVG